MKKSVKYTDLSDEALMKKWLSTFGKGVDKNIMEEHVTYWSWEWEGDMYVRKEIAEAEK